MALVDFQFADDATSEAAEPGGKGHWNVRGQLAQGQHMSHGTSLNHQVVPLVTQ